jgi:two-component system nitrogen regulation response regulator NtrX
MKKKCNIDGDMSLKEATRAFERDYILQKLEDYNGNIADVAEHLDLKRTYLYEKMKALDIKRTGK